MMKRRIIVLAIYILFIAPWSALGSDVTLAPFHIVASWSAVIFHLLLSFGRNSFSPNLTVPLLYIAALIYFVPRLCFATFIIRRHRRVSLPILLGVHFVGTAVAFLVRTENKGISYNDAATLVPSIVFLVLTLGYTFLDWRWAGIQESE